MNKAPGKVFLIPCFLSENAVHTLPEYVKETLSSLHHFFVENERSARRFMKALNPGMSIPDRILYPMNEHQPPDIPLAKKLLTAGHNLGLISEAGYPCIADPGHTVVLAAHTIGAAVVPLTGPTSIFLALGASGMNGQNFQFSGYLPVKPPARIQALRELEKRSRQFNQTQIFIETPYRNRQLLQDILQHCNRETLLCIAADITGENEFIRTLRIGDWVNQLPELHKRPAIFLLSAS